MARWRARRGLDSEEEPAPIFEDLWPIWMAWHELHARRPIGMGPGGIPWSESSRYCEDHGVVGVQRLRWCRLIGAMDLAYFAHQSAKSKKEAADGDPRSRS